MARLLLFAAAREAAGCQHADVTATSVGELLAEASVRFGPAFERVLPYCSVVVADTVVAPDRTWATAVGDDTEVAVLPPVSGGCGQARQRSESGGPS